MLKCPNDVQRSSDAYVEVRALTSDDGDLLSMSFQPALASLVKRHGGYLLALAAVLTAAWLLFWSGVIVKPAKRDARLADALLPYALRVTPSMRAVTDLRLMNSSLEGVNAASTAAEVVSSLPPPPPSTGDGNFGNGAPPDIGATGVPTALKVGESHTVTFSFFDSERDTLLAGVVGLQPQPLRDAVFVSPKRIVADRRRLERPADIEILPSVNPNEVTWRITGRRPGTLIVAATATEVFSSVQDGEMRPVAGNVTYHLFPIQISDGVESVEPLTLEDEPSDATMRLGEAFTWSAVSRATAARPPAFDYAVLNVAEPAVEASFSSNAVTVKSVRPGFSLLIGCATDGLNAHSFIRRIDVKRDAPDDGRVHVRNLFSNVVTMTDRDAAGRVTVGAWGERLDEAKNAVIVSEEGGAMTVVPFQSRAATSGRFSFQPAGTGTHLVWLTNDAGEQVSETVHLHCLGVQVTGMLRVRRDAASRPFALIVRGQGFGESPVLLVDGERAPGRVKRTLLRQPNQRVFFTLPEGAAEKSEVALQVVNRDGYASDTYLLSLED
jgi:hypothetical protein